MGISGTVPTASLGENIHHRFADTVFSCVEGTLLDFEFGFRTDAHGGEDGGVEIFDRHRLISQAWALIGGCAVEEAFFRAAAKHENR